MRLILSMLVLVFAMAAGVGAQAADGAALFASLKCGMCHKPDKKAAAISLAEIDRDLFGQGKALSNSSKERPGRSWRAINGE